MRVAFLLWPDTFEDWYSPLGVSRADYLSTYDGEWSTSLARVLVDSGIEVHLVHGTLGDAELRGNLRGVEGGRSFDAMSAGFVPA